ncbi:PA0069 family radical SAM protein [Marinigracilibium pacificum]|uniref:PA0069 family radical SAM protein n=1 Tax=Marinigracilibium pacificum TaxID=2729599 RepID=A0A848J348_9BACT|nr:PA0069 family radical SAM protein [Marinigracilibium pacificum]NMM50151.1 PA0069 family radical SAM protein [Marinigracilibium pacificum]
MKGRGSDTNFNNRFSERKSGLFELEGIDIFDNSHVVNTKFYNDSAKKVINRVSSPDLNLDFSVNPYQGCEHGCSYCYARMSHEYWGWSPGLDFETKIIVKRKVPELLEKELLSPSWKVAPIMLSGNTDCYQPVERKLKITRDLLKVFNRLKHPVSLITKNSLVERDLDIIEELADENLIHIYISITSLDENLRRVMEPRTAAGEKRLEVVRKLSEKGVPVGVMVAPVIPGLNNTEIPQIIKLSAEAGASKIGYTVLRLSKPVYQVFDRWLKENFPERYNKVINQVKTMHGGDVSDLKWGRRIKGDGPLATMISQTFHANIRKHLGERQMPAFNLTAFRRGGMLKLDF